MLNLNCSYKLNFTNNSLSVFLPWKTSSEHMTPTIQTQNREILLSDYLQCFCLLGTDPDFGNSVVPRCYKDFLSISALGLALFSRGESDHIIPPVLLNDSNNFTF